MRHPISPTSMSPALNALGFATQQPGAGQLNYSVTKHGPSAALLDKVRALDSLPRLGELRTLDLRGNDIRVREFTLNSRLPRLACCFHGNLNITEEPIIDIPSTERRNVHLSSAETKPYIEGFELERKQD